MMRNLYVRPSHGKHARAVALDPAPAARCALAVFLSLALVFGLLPALQGAVAIADEEADETEAVVEVEATDEDDEATEADEADEAVEDDAEAAEAEEAEASTAEADEETEAEEADEVIETDVADEADDDAADEDATETVYADYSEGEIIIVYEDEVLSLDDATLEDAGVVDQEEIVDNVVVAMLDEDTTVEEAIAQLEDDESIAYVQPNYTYTLLSTSTDDPYNTDDTSTTYNQYYLYASGFVDAWDYVTVSGSVTIAVLDTGCNLQHEDLADTVNAELAYDVTTGTLLSASGVANNGDALGHGTQVCGVIAAAANNGIGIAGASYNATVLPIKVFDSSGTCTTADIVAAYQYLADLIDAGKLTDLRVINMSIGAYLTEEEMTETDKAMETAIENLLYNYGVLTVCAGGNGTDGVTAETAAIYPADFDACISVTALAADGSNATYSDYNEYKDISAYGEKILTTSASGGYAKTTGTSMAAPQVAAAIALIWAANSSLSASEVVAILKDTATEVTGNAHASSGSAGALDVEAAVLAALATTGSSSSSTSSSTDSTTTSSSSSSTTTVSTAASVSYRAHCQTYGWLSWVTDGATAGTTGQSKRLEAIRITVDSELSGSITYRVHCQTYGWTSWVSDGETAGTTGLSKRAEAIQIVLTGELAEYYDVYYRVHVQTYGWTDWACNGEACGSAGLSKRMEAIQIVLVEKGGDAPGATDDTYYTSWLVKYESHVQTYGWLSWIYDGALSGTTGKSKRLEAVQIKVNTSVLPYSGSITYRVHVQTYGWLSWVSNGATAGTTGQSKRLEAIQIKLTGELAEYYDVWYRVYVTGYGWLGWTCNGGTAGSTGLSLRAEAIEVVLVEKGGDAPGSTANAYIS